MRVSWRDDRFEGLLELHAHCLLSDAASGLEGGVAQPLVLPHMVVMQGSVLHLASTVTNSLGQFDHVTDGSRGWGGSSD